MYNMSLVNATNPVVLVKSISDVFFEGWLGTLILFALFIILLLAFYQFNGDIKGALVYCGFVMAIISVWFRLMSWINDLVVFLAWALYVIFLLVVIFTRDR